MLLSIMFIVALIGNVEFRYMLQNLNAQYKYFVFFLHFDVFGSKLQYLMRNKVHLKYQFL